MLLENREGRRDEERRVLKIGGGQIVVYFLSFYLARGKSGGARLNSMVQIGSKLSVTTTRRSGVQSFSDGQSGAMRNCGSVQ